VSKRLEVSPTCGATTVKTIKARKIIAREETTTELELKLVCRIVNILLSSLLVKTLLK